MTTVTEHQPRPRRNVELLLLLPALGVGIGGYALVSAGVDGSWPMNLPLYAGGMAVLAIMVHLALRFRAPYADPVILPVAVALNTLGLALIHRVDLGRNPATSFAGRQLMWSALGALLATAVLLFLRDHRWLRRYTFTAMVAGLLLLLLPLIPGLGKTINGARIWIGVGPFSFQPGELAKIALTVFFAGYLVTQRDNLSLVGRKILGLRFPRGRDLGPLLIAWVASIAVLVLQRDLGTSLLFFGIFVAMIYVATERVSWVLLGLGLFLLGAVSASMMFSHVRGRVNGWLHAMDSSVYNADYGSSYQLVQGLFGMANGGLVGTGLGRGSPNLVPYAESDFVIATLGEELGLAGLMAILCLYMVFVERGIRTAIGVRDGFGKLLAGGLAFTVALQCFVVAGGVTRVIPLTGLTMPLLAYGGSSLLANWIIVGLLLRISDSARRPARPVTGSVPIVSHDANQALTQSVPRLPGMSRARGLARPGRLQTGGGSR